MFILNESYVYTFCSDGLFVYESRTGNYVCWFSSLTQAFDSLDK